jgi:hypothetical protein
VHALFAAADFADIVTARDLAGIPRVAAGFLASWDGRPPAGLPSNERSEGPELPQFAFL